MQPHFHKMLKFEDIPDSSTYLSSTCYHWFSCTVREFVLLLIIIIVFPISLCFSPTSQIKYVDVQQNGSVLMLQMDAIAKCCNTKDWKRHRTIPMCQKYKWTNNIFCNMYQETPNKIIALLFMLQILYTLKWGTHILNI